MYDPSPAALRPLMETFWTARGWRTAAAYPEPDVLARAVQAGVMFTGPRVYGHDGWVQAARDAASSVPGEEAARAFLASLTTRRLDLRSAMGSYAVTRFLPEHPFTAIPGTSVCGVCALPTPDTQARDPNEFSFERFKWGGVRRDDITYAAFDLEQFTRAPMLPPTRADIDLGREILSFLRQLPRETTAAQAAPRLTMIKGSKAERGIILEILGVCGILQNAARPGYADGFVPYSRRALPPGRFIFGGYPICWWTAVDGINAAALHEFLPQLT